MIKIKLLSYALSLVGMAATTAYSQDTASDVAPPDAGPTGEAPGMKVQLLNPGEPTKQYAVILYQGDEAFSGLLEFAEKYHVTSAHFSAIGAVNGATAIIYLTDRLIVVFSSYASESSPRNTARSNHVF